MKMALRCPRSIATIRSLFDAKKIVALFWVITYRPARKKDVFINTPIGWKSFMDIVVLVPSTADLL